MGKNWPGGRPGGHHTPACTCCRCNEERNNKGRSSAVLGGDEPTLKGGRHPSPKRAPSGAHGPGRRRTQPRGGPDGSTAAAGQGWAAGATSAPGPCTEAASCKLLPLRRPTMRTPAYHRAPGISPAFKAGSIAVFLAHARGRTQLDRELHLPDVGGGLGAARGGRGACRPEGRPLNSRQ